MYMLQSTFLSFLFYIVYLYVLRMLYYSNTIE